MLIPLHRCAPRCRFPANTRRILSVPQRSPWLPLLWLSLPWLPLLLLSFWAVWKLTKSHSPLWIKTPPRSSAKWKTKNDGCLFDFQVTVIWLCYLKSTAWIYLMHIVAYHCTCCCLIYIQKAEHFKRYLPDKACTHTQRWKETDGHTHLRQQNITHTATNCSEHVTIWHKSPPPPELPTDPKSLHLHSHQLDHCRAEDWRHLGAAVVTTVTAVSVEWGVPCHT